MVAEWIRRQTDKQTKKCREEDKKGVGKEREGREEGKEREERRLVSAGEGWMKT